MIIEEYNRVRERVITWLTLHEVDHLGTANRTTFEILTSNCAVLLNISTVTNRLFFLLSFWKKVLIKIINTLCQEKG